MKISSAPIIATALTAAGIAVVPAAHAGPTIEQLCDVQSWPRPVPDVVGLIFEPYSRQIPAGRSGGALACWDHIRGVTQDGRDASKAATDGWDTITAISPPPGTLVDRHQPLTVHLAPIDHDAPQTFRPCDWVTTAEVADIFGFRGTVETDGYVPPGSVEPQCIYRDPGRTAISTALYVVGAFPVDAAAAYSLSDNENARPVNGLGLGARCITDLRGAQGSRYNQLVVLLNGNRLFEANGFGAQPCEQLTQLAETAIDRIQHHHS